VYRPVVPVYSRFLDRSISEFQSISRNSESHVESVQPIKCMIFILICNKIEILETDNKEDVKYIMYVDK